MSRWEITFDPRVDVRDPEIVGLIVEAEAYRRSVLRIPLPPTMRQKFDELNIRRQIRGTTGIEGNPLTEGEIEKVLDASRTGGGTKEGEAASVEKLEVINARRALEYVQEIAADSPPDSVTEDLIRTLHRLNTEGCGYPNNLPGEYRQHAVVAREYRPPDHDQIPRLMREFVEFINAREAIQGYRALIRAILAHFYLISIHPFGDGNGRTARALEAYILYQGGYNVRGFYSLANFHYKHRQDYFTLLQEARFTHQGDLTRFVRFSLEGFVGELALIQDEILDYVRRVMFRDVYFEAARQGELNARSLSLLEHLTFDAREGISVEAFKNRTHYLSAGLYEGRTDKTLLRDLRHLQRSQLIAIEQGRLMANLGLLGG